ncbi:Serine/threonine-protein kinase [Actinidia chinensis var. chinensis]|uniref:Serine/threonine-protein kinase n=1 Tax=Actinidia chinensis var. chinensis TaxID=1590841 RepID=A0A2R6QPA5_ACTCC|nr:Serine/threonine-protein kinase [Actinidia chinensis var. chinensis]
MNVCGNTQKEKKSSTLFSPRLRPAAPINMGNQGKEPANGSRCCRVLINDCIKSHHHPSPLPPSRLEHQVAELEKEVQKQKELRVLYKIRLERTQDYLRHCLQIAQENGFLDIIIDNKDNQQECLLASDIILANISPQTPTPIHPHCDIVALVHQAKANGWYIDPHEIELHEKVGKGTTADIYKATWRGLEVAVKCLYPEFFLSNDSGFTFFAQEVETLSFQHHPFVLRLIGACLDPPDYGWVVTEFLSITLKEWLHGPRGRRDQRIDPLPALEERVGKAIEIAQAMQYLHEHKPKAVIHRDLKPSNIFLDDSFHVRVADFGHAKFLSAEEKALSGETGTHVYMAPEVIRCEPYNEKCDVYSFGIILNELITGEYPYIETDYSPCRIAMEVAEGRLRPALAKDDDHQQLEELIELIKLSWDDAAAKRPSFAHINTTLKTIQERFLEPFSCDYA